MMGQWLYAAALPLEMIGLFGLWRWFRGLGGMPSLLLGVMVALGISVILGMAENPIGIRYYIALFAMYLLSRLLWAWWMEGLSPDRWCIGEMAVALSAATMFAIANSPN